MFVCMGKVVKLDAARRNAAQRNKRTSARQRRRRKQSKTALVLGGGGFTGGVYEIGALRALDLLSVNRSVNQFDVYVGTSAGSFVAAMTANGITPEEMMRVVNQQVPTPFRDVDAGHAAAPQPARVRLEGGALPLHTAGLIRSLAATWGQVTAMDIVLGLAEALPSGLYSGSGRREVRAHGALRPRPHRRLPLCSSPSSTSPPPTSTRASASCSAPRAGTTCRSQRGPRVDGAADGLQAGRDQATASWSTAGSSRPRTSTSRSRPGQARRRRQPARAVRQRVRQADPDAARPKVRRVSDMGFPQIGYQTFKLLAYQRLHEIAREVGAALPGRRHRPDRARAQRRADVPDVVMNFASRVDIARHGFQSVTLKLAEDYAHFQQVAKRHGIEISATRVRKVVKHFAAERSARAPGARSSSRPPARCCASRGDSGSEPRSVAPSASSSAGRGGRSPARPHGDAHVVGRRRRSRRGSTITRQRCRRLASSSP